MTLMIRTWLFILLVVPQLSAQQKPNIIFILIDDQRYDFLSYHDHPWIKTTHIDKLAENSMYFNNAFVTTSLCSPSRASILTGQYAHAHGVMNNDTPLPGDIPTFPKELQKQGYKTGFIGKWHMGGNNDNPRPGFDHWVSFKGQGPYFDPTFNVDGKYVDKKGYTTDLMTDYAIDFIRENQKGEEPYFLYLSHKAIHSPFSPAPRHEKSYDDLKVIKPDNFPLEKNLDKPLWVQRQRDSWHGADRDFNILDINSFDKLVEKYSEAMLSVDESVGRVADHLRMTNDLENTVIIYFSDNGYLLGEHGLIDKRVMHEESIRVPCFVHWPAVINESSKREEMVLNIDLGPTILELAGTQAPSTMHGYSFAHMIRGEKERPWRKAFLYEYFVDPMAVQTPTIFGLRTEKYSYMTYEGVWDIYELYDLEKDPAQNRNLFSEIRTGHDYGSFLQIVSRQDPALWKLAEPLDRELTELMLSKGAVRNASYKK